jgi:hypothetical protein
VSDPTLDHRYCTTKQKVPPAYSRAEDNARSLTAVGMTIENSTRTLKTALSLAIKRYQRKKIGGELLPQELKAVT